MLSVEIQDVIVIGIFSGMGFQELLVIGIIAVILFGKNLPDVAKKAGKYYYDFTRGLREMQTDLKTSIESGTNESQSYTSEDEPAADDYDVATAPRFEPPPSEPVTSADAPKEE